MAITKSTNKIQFIKAIDFDFKDIAIKFSKELIKDLR